MSAEVQKRTNKQHTNTRTKNLPEISNLRCSTGTGIMFKNLTVHDTDAVSSNNAGLLLVAR